MTEIPMTYYLILSAFLLCAGLVIVLIKKNTVFVLLGIELMLNAVNVNLVAFWRFRDPETVTGQAFAIIVFAVAAAEVAVGLALIISLYRMRNTVAADEIDMMKW